VGNDGETLVADSSTATGLKWAAPSAGSSNVAGKNSVLNSNFSVWQRGTSFTFANLKPYTADRWQAVSPSGSTSATCSRQTTSDTTNLPNIKYAARVQRTAGNTITSPLSLTQSFETENSVPFAGKQVTLSFYARRGANFSGASNNLSVYLYTGTGTDQNINTSYTGLATPINNQTATLTTTWQRFSFTATLSSSTNEIAFEFPYTPVGTAGADDWFEITGVQLEAAASASAYSPNAATFQGELAACQRYYQRWDGSSGYSTSGVGLGIGSTDIDILVNAPVSFRIIPTTATYASLGVADGTAAPLAVTAIVIYHPTLTTVQMRCTVASGGVQYRPYFLLENATSAGFLAIDVEL
jgi:hypothetical protein